MDYRVVYGETMPAWEKTFPTIREAIDFAERHMKVGDVIFSIAIVDPGDTKPHSMMAAIEQA